MAKKKSTKKLNSPKSLERTKPLRSMEKAL
jgi:hypothetical protein